MDKDKLYGGLSKIETSIDEYQIDKGIIIRKTYAHLFAPFMTAFSPPGKHKFHGGPWKATKGGIAFDVLVEIEVSPGHVFNETFKQEEIIWVLTALIRLSSHPYIINSTISDTSFNIIKNVDVEPTIYPNETKYRIFAPIEDKAILSQHDLDWLKEYFHQTLKLMKENQKFYHAFKAFDSSTISGKTSLALLTIWGAIEQLFSPNTGELKYRVSSNLAGFLNERGEERLKIFKELSKLYNERSVAAHTSKDVDHSHVISSFVHFRNALIKIIEQGKVPSQEDLEELLFT